MNGAADGAVEAVGHEPNGYFWQGFAQFAWPGLSQRVSFDSEGGTFVACSSDEEPLLLLKSHWESMLTDAGRVAEIVARADSEGFDFDD